jgi:cytochrome c oxidase assembly factor CtaG
MFQTKRMFLVLQKKKKPIPSCQQHLKHKNQIRIIIIIVLIIIIIKTVKKKKNGNPNWSQEGLFCFCCSLVVIVF